MNVDEEIKAINQKLETTLEIVMDHFHESQEKVEELDERCEQLEQELENMKNGFSKNVNK